MNGVQKALQRTRRRSSLSSSKLFFGNGLSTIFDKDRRLIYGFSGRFTSCLSLVYYEHTPKSNSQVTAANTTCQPRSIRLQENIMPKKSLVIDVHHHWMPDEHYRRPELYIRQDEEVIHQADRFRIRRAGVQLFSPLRMEAQLKVMARAGVDQAALRVGVWLDWLDIKATRISPHGDKS